MDLEKNQDTSLSINQADLTTLVNGNNTFAFDLYGALKNSKDNLFYSPYSISEILAMVYAGARNRTEEELAYTLHFTLQDNNLHRAFQNIDQQFYHRGTKNRVRDRQSSEIFIANELWMQKGYTFLREFLALLSKYYDTRPRTVDFVTKSEQSRTTINKWISDQTKEKIKDLVPSGAIDSLTRFVPTSAVYFKAAWKHPFDQTKTSDNFFHLLDGSTIVVPMMKQTEFFGYAESETYQAVDLHYDDSDLSMVILLPAVQKYATFQDSLNSELANSIINKLEHREVILSLPKFKFGCGINLNEALRTLGINQLFTRDADLTGITSEKDIFISSLMHSAFISVDEAGTEAAAVSAMIAAAAMPDVPVEMTINRPFIFFIRDIATKVVLFIGRVINPVAFSA